MRGSVPTHRLSLIFDFFEQKKKHFSAPAQNNFIPCDRLEFEICLVYSNKK
jgi:hypothetical protein